MMVKIKRFVKEFFLLFVCLVLLNLFIIKQFAMDDYNFFFRKSFEEAFDITKQKDVSLPIQYVSSTTAEQNKLFLNRAIADVDVIWKDIQFNIANQSYDGLVLNQKLDRRLKLPLLKGEGFTKDNTQEPVVLVGQNIGQALTTMTINDVVYKIVGIIGEKGVSGFYDDRVIFYYEHVPAHYFIFDDFHLISTGYSVYREDSDYQGFVEQTAMTYQLDKAEVELYDATTKALSEEELSAVVLDDVFMYLAITLLTTILLFLSWIKKVDRRTQIKHIYGATKWHLLCENITSLFILNAVAIIVAYSIQRISIYYDATILPQTRDITYVFLGVIACIHMCIISIIATKKLMLIEMTFNKEVGGE